MEPKICFSGKSCFKREDKSKKENLFQFTMKKNCFTIATWW